MIGLNNIPRVRRKTAKRVGRGGSHGTTAGRGTKGSKARGRVPPHIEGGGVPLYRRLPKLSKMKFHKKTCYRVINIEDLNVKFDGLPEVNSTTVVDRQLCEKLGLANKGDKIKLLGKGDPSRRYTIALDYISTTAKQKLKSSKCNFVESDGKV